MNVEFDVSSIWFSEIKEDDNGEFEGVIYFAVNNEMEVTAHRRFQGKTFDNFNPNFFLYKSGMKLSKYFELPCFENSSESDLSPPRAKEVLVICLKTFVEGE